MLAPATLRRDPLAFRQLHAALAVMEVYLDDAIADSDLREVNRCVRELVAYLRWHRHGRVCDAVLNLDPINVLKRLRADERLDQRYRSFNLERAITRIEASRAGRADRCVLEHTSRSDHS